jgi:rhamnosyltransferase
MDSLNKRPALTCSIVIRAYNEEKHIGRLLTGIMQQTIIKEVEIILVDSGSKDATTSIAARYPVKILHIPPEDFTFGRSLNLGISHACGEFVVAASAHVYPVYPDWLENLLAPFEDLKTGLSYGKQRGNSSSKFSEHQVFARWFPDTPNLRQAHPFCNNANAAVRRSLWEIRPYDETLTGLEDLEWARWALEQGNRIAYVPEGEVVHVHQETLRGIYNRYRREAMAFKKIFSNERFSLLDFFRLFISNTASDWWHAGRQRVLWSNASDILWFRLMQFWGTYQGFRQSGPLTSQLRQTFYYPGDLLTSPEREPRQVEPIQYHDAAD